MGRFWIFLIALSRKKGCFLMVFRFIHKICQMIVNRAGKGMVRELLKELPQKFLKFCFVALQLMANRPFIELFCCHLIERLRLFFVFQRGSE